MARYNSKGEWVNACKCGCGAAVKPPYMSWAKGHRYPNKIKPAIERFLAKVVVNPITSCWEWQAALDSNGYGIFAREKHDVGFAHRFSYEYFENGAQTLPPSIKVLHRCDNPPCVNPEHLFTGTQEDNIIDMWKKGRGLQGRKASELSRHRRIDEAIARKIIILLEEGCSTKKIVNALSVSRPTVNGIKQGASWAWLKEEMREENCG